MHFISNTSKTQYAWFGQFRSDVTKPQNLCYAPNSPSLIVVGAQLFLIQSMADGFDLVKLPLDAHLGLRVFQSFIVYHRRPKFARMELVLFDRWVQIFSIFRSQFDRRVTQSWQVPVSVDVTPNIIGLDSILRHHYQYLVSLVFIQHAQSSIWCIDVFDRALCSA